MGTRAPRPARLCSIVCLSALAVLGAGCEAALGISPPSRGGPDGDLPVHTVTLPDGLEIAVWARVSDARSLALGPEGTVFVGNRRGDSVWAVRDSDGDHRADRVVRIASGLEMPNGVAVRGGDLYVAEVSRVIRFPGIEGRLDDPPPPEVVRDDFPEETRHGWKHIAFGPDGLLYVPVGAPCNVCQSEDERFATIMRMRPDGSGLEIFARGVRNTVGFDWHPSTGELWFTDNGRDWMGDDRPPDELNRAPEPGLHFGFPFCHGRDLADPEYGSRRPCSETVPPVRELGPHVAALGMLFATGKQLPASVRNRILIAEHGSWNRSRKIGYRITMVDPAQNPPSYEVFADGWLQGERAWGRPVDLLELPDGSLLVSDDHAGAVYRIARPQGDR